MKRKISLILALLLLALTTVTVGAQSSGNYDLSWSSIDGGGGEIGGGTYTLNGTLGQFDAGVLSGGSYTLSQGFWGGLTVLSQFNVYLPLILR